MQSQGTPASSGRRKGIKDRGRGKKTVAAVIAKQKPVAVAGHERGLAAEGCPLLSERIRKARLSLKASKGVSGSVMDVHAQLALGGRRVEPLQGQF